VVNHRVYNALVVSCYYTILLIPRIFPSSNNKINSVFSVNIINFGFRVICGTVPHTTF